MINLKYKLSSYPISVINFINMYKIHIKTIKVKYLIQTG